MFLANCIWFFHLIVILIILVVPFTNIPALLLMHSVFSISLLTHWYFNNNICSLTLMESTLRGIPTTKSFSHQFISPIYDMSNSDLSSLCYIIVISLLIISLYKFLKSDALKDTIKCLKSDKSNSTEKMIDTFKRKASCFLPILVI